MLVRIFVRHGVQNIINIPINANACTKDNNQKNKNYSNCRVFLFLLIVLFFLFPCTLSVTVGFVGRIDVIIVIIVVLLNNVFYINKFFLAFRNGSVLFFVMNIKRLKRFKRFFVRFRQLDIHRVLRLCLCFLLNFGIFGLVCGLRINVLRFLSLLLVRGNILHNRLRLFAVDNFFNNFLCGFAVRLNLSLVFFSAFFDLRKNIVDIISFFHKLLLCHY